MYSQFIQPTSTASPGILCSSTQMQLLLYQFLLHVQPNVDSRCVQSLQELLQFRKDESPHLLGKCQQEVNNLTSMHFSYLISVHKSWERTVSDHALEISKYVDQTESFSKEIEEYKMELQNLKRNTEKDCPKEVAAPEENVTVKQVSSEVLCEKDATVEKINQGLVYAASMGNSSLVSTYLNCGADPNSAVHLAAYYGSSEIVQMLVDRGADMDLVRKNDKSTPLHVAVQYGHADVVRLLLSKGAETDVRRSDECTPLYQASALGNVQIVQMLLEYNASLEWRCVNDSTPLHVAAKKNHISVTSVLLEHGADVNGRDSNNKTGLHLAAQLGNLEIVRLLIQYNVNVNQPDKDGWTALHVASEHDHVQIAKALLQAGANVNIQAGEYSQTPLYIATVYNNPEIVKLLIQHNANVNQPDKDGWTALYNASEHNHIQIAKALLQAGANVNILAGKYSQTPLCIAAVSNNPEIVKLLIQHNAKVNQPDKDGWTALHGASQRNLKGTARSLLEAGADVNVLGGPELEPPLFSAALKGNREIVKLLIQHNANVNLPNKDGWTALHVASKHNHVQIAKALLQAGANVNILPGKHSQTPLYIAAVYNNPEIVKLLTQHNANVNQLDKNGWTALHGASQRNLKDTAKALLEAGADINALGGPELEPPLFTAAWRHSQDAVKLLIQHGANVNLQNKDGWTALHVASELNHIRIAKVLLEGGADVDMLGGPNSKSPLYVATYNGNKEMVKLLIQHNANVNLPKKNGWTVLHVACEQNQIEIGNSLLEAGADVNKIAGQYSETCLYLATFKDNLEMVKLLIQHNADVNLINKDGWTALHVASKRNRLPIAEALLEAGADVNVKLPANDFTPLHLAAYYGHLEMVKRIVNKGANLKQYSKPENRTPRDYAIANGHKQVAEYLASVGG